jgi:hypothetical protein
MHSYVDEAFYAMRDKRLQSTTGIVMNATVRIIVMYEIGRRGSRNSVLSRDTKNRYALLVQLIVFNI